jgi:hypothetical protein
LNNTEKCVENIGDPRRRGKLEKNEWSGLKGTQGRYQSRMNYNNLIQINYKDLDQIEINCMTQI